MALAAAQPSDTNMVTGCGLDPEPPCGSWGHHEPPDINTDPSCGRTMDPGNSLDPDVTMALGNMSFRSSRPPQ